MTHRDSLGDILQEMHELANKPAIDLRMPKKRRCYYGNHAAPQSGGVIIAGKWCCEKCKGIMK